MSTQTVSHQPEVPPFTSTPCFVTVNDGIDPCGGYECREASVICPKCGENAEVCRRHLIDGVCIECAE